MSKSIAGKLLLDLAVKNAELSQENQELKSFCENQAAQISVLRGRLMALATVMGKVMANINRIMYESGRVSNATAILENCKHIISGMQAYERLGKETVEICMEESRNIRKELGEEDEDEDNLGEEDA